jgi:putative oxidoreductase
MHIHHKIRGAVDRSHAFDERAPRIRDRHHMPTAVLGARATLDIVRPLHSVEQAREICTGRSRDRISGHDRNRAVCHAAARSRNRDPSGTGEDIALRDRLGEETASQWKERVGMSSRTETSTAFGAGARGAPASSTALPHGDMALLIGRILLGGIFVVSGYGKVTAVAAFAASLEKRGVPFAPTMAIIGAYVEFIGGLLVVLGIEVRYVAVLMIAFVIVATLISHRFWELQDALRDAQRTQFSKNVAIAGGFFVLHAAGGGRFALERLWRG